jgi:hypothetical protein
VARTFCLFLSAVIEAIVTTIPDVQVSAGAIDVGPPTHSILSKDHPDHPLHAVAARGARDCTRRVVQAVANAWGAAGSTRPTGWPRSRRACSGTRPARTSRGVSRHDGAHPRGALGALGGRRSVADPAPGG